MLLTEAHDLVHGEEVAGVIEFVDDRQFFLDLLFDRLRYVAADTIRADVVAITLACALPGEFAHVLHRSGAVGQLLGGIAVTQLLHREGTHLGDLASTGHSERVVREERCECLRRMQRMLGIPPDTAAGGRDLHAMTDAVEDIVQLAA